MSTLVMKFGGSAVGTTTALTQVVSIVLQEQERWDKLIVVVSALEGVTDQLIEAAHLAQISQRRGYRRITGTIRSRHMALVEQLPLGANERSALQADIDQLLFEMLDVCQALADSPSEIALTPDKTDAIIGTGERLAARIIAALLRQNNVRGVALDATDLIITDDTFGNARPDMALTSARVSEHLLPILGRIVPVVTGFVGGTVTGKPTTLGRGGSDYTASILAVCSDAREVWIWTDVDGMMSADPREVADAKVIRELSYDEVAELAYFGARILHSRMVTPLEERGIALRIKNVYKPQQPGTLIHNITRRSPVSLKAVTSIHGISLYAHQSGPLSTISAIVDAVLFRTIGSHADVMISAQSSSQSFVCFVIPTSAGPDAVHNTLISLDERLHESDDLLSWHVRPVTIITIIGANLDAAPSLAGNIFASLGDTRILALSQGPSHCSLSLVVETQAGEQALRRIHAAIINSASDSDQLPSR